MPIHDVFKNVAVVAASLTLAHFGLKDVALVAASLTLALKMLPSFESGDPPTARLQREQHF